MEIGKVGCELEEVMVGRVWDKEGMTGLIKGLVGVVGVSL